jgi:hypothetical protein
MMVATAEQEQVVEGGRAAVSPVDDVVSLAPRVRAIASREAAMLVSKDHSAAHGRWDDRSTAADIEWF